MSLKVVFMALGAIIIATSCENMKKDKPAEIPGIDLANMDTTANPADDFFRYVNGGWLDKTEVPSDRGRWGSFDELRKETTQKVLSVLETAIESGKYEIGTDQAKAALFYQVAMDTAYLDQLGVKPIESEIQKINKITDLEQLKVYLIEAAPLQDNLFFGFGVGSNPNNSDINAAFLGPGSLGLPERDYYLRDDEDAKNIQQEYKKHIVRMYRFISENDASEVANDIYELEKLMAQERMSKEERRNPLKRNNPRSVEQLNELAGTIEWDSFFTGIGADKLDTVIVTDINYFSNLNTVLTADNLPVLKEYLKWTTLRNAANYLSTDIVKANFEFYGKVLQGTEEMKPRYERVLDIANWIIGEAIGKLYVDTHFPPEAKATALEMVNNIKIAFGERIKALDWMSEPTKEKALQKLTAFKVKIGYPDEWKDYSQMEIKGKEAGGSYYGNMVNASLWNWKQDLAKIGKPVDKSEWFMAPQVVNAYYNPAYNEIVFPAAILQPPFYNYKADPAVNYGGIGAVIGHEMSHGFDDQGSRYDANGNLTNWWTEEDRIRFEERSKKLVAQFDEYEPLEGVNVNGTFTLGENIGDLGGVNVAYDGLQRHIAEHGDPGTINGYNQDQRFFISWSTIWRTKYRDEALKNQIDTDELPGNTLFR